MERYLGLIGFGLMVTVTALWITAIILFVNWVDEYITFPGAILVVSIITIFMVAFVFSLANRASEQ